MPVVDSKYRGTIAYQQVLAELVIAARSRDTVTYGRVGELMGIFTPGNHLSRETGLMIGSISEDEHAHGRPMLSAIVVRQSGDPGEGFYDLAHRLGLLHDDSAAGELSFWHSTMESVYDTWKLPAR